MGVVLHNRIGELALGQRLLFELGSRQIRLMHLHEVDAHEERLGRLRVAVEEWAEHVPLLEMLRSRTGSQKPTSRGGPLLSRQIAFARVRGEVAKYRSGGGPPLREFGYALPGLGLPVVLPKGPNERWSLDFVSDCFSNGRRFRILAIVDDFTRETLALIPDTRCRGCALHGSSTR
jgi:transposase InsO family protein